MKYVMAIVFAAALMVAAAYPTLAETPVIKQVEYEGKGRVDVEFVSRVAYENVEITVADDAGTSYVPTIWEMDDDDLTFAVENIAEGRNYSFTISGVRTGFSGAAETVYGTFAVPATGELAVKGFDYDAKDGELEIEFYGKVEYDNPAVEITDASGRSYEVKLRELDRDSMELRVSGLERGAEYTASVSGVRTFGAADFGSAQANFIAW